MGSKKWNWKQWDKSLRRRLIAMGIVAALLLLVFLARLIQFQLVQGPNGVSRVLPPVSSQSDFSGETPAKPDTSPSNAYILVI